MTTIRLTKEFRFETAHALEGYDGACKHIHGHSYILFVTVSGTPCDDPQNPKYGMVMDFGDLKRIVNRTVVDRYDHALVVRPTEHNDALITAITTHYEKVYPVDFQPTCENMIARFAHDISAELPDRVRLVSLRLHETATSYAEWFAADNQ